MALTEDDITATNSLTVANRLTIREGNPTNPGDFVPTFAEFLVNGALSKAFIRGKVGVGTVNPLNMLDVAGGIAVGEISANAPSNGLYVQGSVGIGTNTPTAKLQVAGDLAVSNGGPLSVASSAGVIFAQFAPADNRAFINGKLGVGLSSPVSQLSVAGGASIGNTYAGQAAPSSGLLVEGTVGIGTASPMAKLEVAGTLRVTDSSFLALGAASSVGIGTTTPLARLQVSGGAIMPSPGNTLTAGILFPANPGGGAGDQAWIRYFARSGENTTLELGIGNEGSDHVALMPSGNVGIGTLEPVNKLDVAGDIAVSGKHALRGNDSWLRLNQDSAFVGVHTPGLFAPVSLNVGGAGGYGNPGAGNVWVTGNVGIGTTALASFAKLQVVGGAIVPAAGNSEVAGIMFPKDPGGGSSDAAWMRYYPRIAGMESTTLEIGTSNDADDHIALMPSGNVGIGTTNPSAKLDVVGNLRVSGTISGTLAADAVLADGSVTTSKVANNAITAAKIAPGSIGIPQIAANSVPLTKLRASVGNGTQTVAAFGTTKVLIAASFGSTHRFIIYSVYPTTINGIISWKEEGQASLAVRNLVVTNHSNFAVEFTYRYYFLSESDFVL